MVSSSLVKFSKEEHIFHALFGNPTTNNNYYNNYGIIYRGQPYQCSSTLLPKGLLWCNTDSLLYEDGLFD